MRVVTGQLGQQVKAGRRVMDRTFHVVENRVAPAMSTRRAQIAAGAVVVGVGALCIGVLAYRRRRRKTLGSRIQEALPDELVARAGAIKRALG